MRRAEDKRIIGWDSREEAGRSSELNIGLIGRIGPMVE
jgi:hypothetical protein